MIFWEPCVGGGAVSMAVLGGKPFLRWPGGKRWLADRLIRELRLDRADSVVCGDADGDLVAVWQAVQSNAGELVARVESLPTSEEQFYGMRAWRAITPSDRAVRAAYLNRLAFNGLWRKNRKGDFNMPPDKKKLASPPPGWGRAVVEAGKRLGAASFRWSDCVDLLDQAGAGDAAYIDTPYLPEAATGTAFVGYTNSCDWSKPRAHHRVAEGMARAAARGVRVAASNSMAARKIYESALGAMPGFRVVEVSARRSISCKGDGRAIVPEILVFVGDA